MVKSWFLGLLGVWGALGCSDGAMDESRTGNGGAAGSAVTSGGGSGQEGGSAVITGGSSAAAAAGAGSAMSGGSSAAGAGGSSAAGAGGNPTSGLGGAGEGPSPDEVTKAEECKYKGYGGADAVVCDYVRVDFSEPLPASDLQITLTTSSGDVLSSTEPDSVPALVIETNEDETQAEGFAVSMVSGNSYAPEWIDVVVRSGDITAVESRVTLSYSCVALTIDDWCWKADTEALAVTAP
jgi:hypothetical protein